jgi:multidrug transporter EmrE-like cation transporter
VVQQSLGDAMTQECAELSVIFCSRGRGCFGALKGFPLLIVYPTLIEISVSLVVIFAVIFPQERFGIVHAAGLALVILGISCLGWAEWRS